jgi:hypothetical protein
MYSRLGMMDEVPELELIRQVCLMIRMLNANRSKYISFIVCSSYIELFLFLEPELTLQVCLIMLNANRPNNNHDLSVDTADLLFCYSTQIELPGQG